MAERNTWIKGYSIKGVKLTHGPTTALTATFGEMFGSDGSDPYGSSPYMATSATTLADLESFLAGAGDGFSADASTDAPFSTDSSRAAGTAWCQCMEGEQNALEQHNLQLLGAKWKVGRPCSRLQAHAEILSRNTFSTPSSSQHFNHTAKS